MNTSFQDLKYGASLAGSQYLSNRGQRLRIKTHVDLACLEGSTLKNDASPQGSAFQAHGVGGAF